MGILTRVRQLFGRGGFVRNASYVMLSKGAIFVFSFVTTPIISRLFIPESYGHFALFNTTLATLVSLVSLEFPSALVITKEKKTGYHLIQIILASTLAFSVFSLAIIILIGPNLLRLLNLPSVDFLYYLIPSLIIGALLNVYNGWLTREKAFSTSSLVSAISNLVSRLATIGIGFYILPDYRGLILGALAGQVLQTIYLSWDFFKREPQFFQKRVTQTQLTSTLKEYHRYPKFLLPGRVLTLFRNQLVFFIIAYYYGSTFLGSYSMTMSLVMIPIQLLSFGLSGVFLEKSVELAKINENAIGQRMEKLIKALFWIGILPFLMAIFGGDWLASLFLGEQWITSGYLAQLVPIQFFFMFILSPFMGLYQVYEQERLRFFMNLFYFLGSVVVTLASAYLMSDWWAVINLTLFSMIVHWIQWYQFYKMAKLSFITKAFPYLLGFIILAVITFLVRHLLFPSELPNLLMESIH